MEHLPRPKNGRRPEQVPYVCSKQYDGGSFLEYPFRESPDAFPNSNNLSYARTYQCLEQLRKIFKPKHEDLLQTWLFFGLINEFLGEFCNSEIFIRRIPDRTMILSTSALLDILQKWVLSIKAGSSTMTYDHVAKCLRRVFETMKATGSTLDPNIKLSILSVGELFEIAANYAFDIEDLTKNNKCPAYWNAVMDNDYWTSTMQHLGWCPSQIDFTLGRPMYLQTLYFFTHLSEREESHLHRECSENRCVALQNNLGAYTTRHRTPECSCNELTVDSNLLDMVLSDGGIPVLRIFDTSSISELSVEVVASHPDTPWIAISHVWADGLGNPRNNALPRCQLSHLKSLIQSLASSTGPERVSPEALLWIDTLCCPVSPDDAKKRALSAMKRTYQHATYVLVIESSLQLCDSETMDAEEILARILLSGWMRRLWTLQEGALSAENRSLWFQFRDKAVNSHEIIRAIKTIYNSGFVRQGLVIDFMNLAKGFMTYKTQVAASHGTDLGTIDTALHFRSVSVPSDEPILLANLLGLDLDNILKGPEHQRFHRMWLMMSSVPGGIPKNILFRLGPRLEDEGLRWAPASMMYYDRSNDILQSTGGSDSQGKPMERGLLVKMAGYRMSMATRPSGLPPNPWNKENTREMQTLYLRDKAGLWYLVYRRLNISHSDFLSSSRLDDYVRSNSEVWVTHLDTEFHIRPEGEMQISIGLLVKSTEEQDTVMYAQSAMHIKTLRVPSHLQDMLEVAYVCARKLSRSPIAEQLASTSDQDIDIENAAYKASFDALGQEILRIATADEQDDALVAAQRRSPEHNSKLFLELIGTMFIGQYASMETRVPSSQQWCID